MSFSNRLINKIFFLFIISIVVHFFSELAFAQGSYENQTETDGSSAVAVKEAHIKPTLFFGSSIELGKKSNYNIYDIVQFKSGNKADLEILKEIPIEKLTKVEILKALKANKNHYNLILADQIQFIQNDKSVKAELERKLKNHLISQCNSCEFEIKINQFPNVQGTQLLFSSEDFDILKGHFLVSIKIENEIKDRFEVNRTAVPSWFSGTWRTYKNVNVLNKWIPQKQRILADDIALEKKDITRIIDKLPDEKEIIGTQLSRVSQAGTIITRDLLFKEKEIKRGDLVKLILSESEVEIQLSGVAENDGGLGDTVKVKANNKVLSAKVKEKGIVVIEN